MRKDSSVDHLDFLIFLSATPMSERIKHNRDTMRLSYGAGVVTNFLGMVKLELNYCIPAWHQPQDKVCFFSDFQNLQNLIFTLRRKSIKLLDLSGFIMRWQPIISQLKVETR